MMDGALTGPVALLVSETFAETYAAQLHALRSVGRGLEIRALTPGMPEMDGEATFFSPDEFPGNRAGVLRNAHRAPSLRWFHTMSAGVDSPIFDRLLERGVRLTTSSGASAVPIAQAVVLDLLALTRRLPEARAHQAAHRWERLMGRDVAGATIVIAGMGPIGCEVARLALALRMRPIGLRRTVTGEEPCETWTLDRWHEAIGAADHLVLALPLAPSNKGLLDAASIARLRPGAIVINVGRGELVDEPALIDALRSGQLGGAGLDVFATEPLPDDSPLWDLPNVIVTPHNSALVPSSRVAMCHIFLDNLGRYLRGEPLRNEVSAR
jgi:phosphoglycerate dehydrogenase-like enzyme